MNNLTRGAALAASSLLAASAFATGSLSVSREAVLDRSPDTVWKLVGAFNSLDVWLPPVLKSTYQGSPVQPGAVRVLDLGEATVTEKLLSYDAANRSYSYAFLQAPLPVKNYVATIEVNPTKDGKTLVKWHSTFDASGAPDDKAKEAILGIYDAGLSQLGAIFRK